ncbi:MAG: DUF4268 domain-containing protein [Fimbriimonas sp.]
MNIGKKVRVEDVRLVWKRETDFSDWLVTEEGVALLAEEIGIEIENLSRESRPGDFPCDIAGNRLGHPDHIVVIENQYGKTDHDHLGKLLTYAAVHKAMTGIWISETISDDHRQVIDWLNENTPPNVNLYLVGLKLFKIGDSAVAPQLDVVSRPNDKVKDIISAGTPAEKERQVWLRGMWVQIADAIRASKPPFRLQKPSSDHWSSIAIGRAGFSLEMLINARDQTIVIQLLISTPWKTHAFEELHSQKSAIEAEIGSALIWKAMPEKKRSCILLELKIDSKSPDNIEKVKHWFRDNSILMYKVFKGRVAQLAEPFNE